MSLEKFVQYGKRASFHFADDTGGEWGQAEAEKQSALALFDAADPATQARMREAARGFLWHYDFLRLRPEVR